MWLIENLGTIVDIASKVVAAAAAIAAITPSPTDDGIVSKMRTVIDFLGFNFGFARNKE
jgi:hypothetical protein